MKKTAKLFTGLFLLLLISSCTLIVATNIPGKKAKAIPKAFCGNFELDLTGTMYDSPEVPKTKVKITSKGISSSDENGDMKFTPIGDSLAWSTIGKTHYLSMGKGELSVFKIEKSGKDLLITPLIANEGVTKEQLEPYFTSVEQMEEDENGVIAYSVKIDDAKLQKFFSSELVVSEKYKLAFKGK